MQCAVIRLRASEANRINIGVDELELHSHFRSSVAQSNYGQNMFQNHLFSLTLLWSNLFLDMFKSDDISATRDDRLIFSPFNVFTCSVSLSMVDSYVCRRAWASWEGGEHATHPPPWPASPPSRIFAFSARSFAERRRREVRAG